MPVARFREIYDALAKIAERLRAVDPGQDRRGEQGEALGDGGAGGDLSLVPLLGVQARLLRQTIKREG